ncbi:MAG: histidine kinase, partial [Chitinophagaceae bacterium]
MKPPSLVSLLILFIFSSMMLVLAFYILANFRRMLQRIRIEWLRKNILVWLIGMCLILAVVPFNTYTSGVKIDKLVFMIGKELLIITIMTLFVFNATLLVLSNAHIKRMPFRRRMGFILFTIVFGTVLCAGVITYINDHSVKNLHVALLSNFYTGAVAGLIYVTMSYTDLERQRKMNEKELEVARLQQLKTKAELDALHSKVNPHFLYNALNSIADLSITDGKKARRMTIALADLFRYSINYSHNNYSTLNDEVAMTEVYLQIEKIRFEDQLTYSVSVEEGLGHYLVPRFILQPLVENAVKHGLKVTGKMTEIFLEVKREGNGMVIYV